jgi:hypothetical protein
MVSSKETEFKVTLRIHQSAKNSTEGLELTFGIALVSPESRVPSWLKIDEPR